MALPSIPTLLAGRRYAAPLWLLSFLFAIRVAGQALQRWLPQPFLPPFSAFQGSTFPYWLLLSAQLVILAMMMRLSWSVHSGSLAPSRRAGTVLAWCGGIYMAGSIVRILVGLELPSAPAWFVAWIPATLHVVLAGFVLTMAAVSSARVISRGGGAAIMARVLPYLWYPTFLAGAIAAFAALLAADASPAIAAYVPIVLVGGAIVMLEMRFTERLEWRPRKSDVKADAAFMAIVQVALPQLLAVLCALSIAEWMHEHAPSAWWPHDWPVIVQIIAVVLLVDFMRYWLHRACHRYDLLWRLHEVHHSPDILYMLNVARFHPFEKVLHFSLDTIPFLLLGVAPEVIAGYFLLYSVNGFFQHSNLRLRYGWLNYLVGSAETHRWHHARDPKTACCNFSNTTIVWDLVFGTWHLPKDQPLSEIGIMDRVYPKDFWSQMLTPFRRHDGITRRTPQAWLANALVALQLYRTRLVHGRRIATAVRDPMRVQLALLKRILRKNRDTLFGRQHGFAGIVSYDAYTQQVPVSDYEALRPFVDAEIERGEKALTAEAPLHYARTSGTTGKAEGYPAYVIAP